MSKPFFYGWTLLGVLWLVFAFNLGFPAYGGPVINSAMAKELGFSRETLGLITTIYIIMSGLPGPVVAMAVNRFGVRRTLIAGSLMNVTGAAFMATVANSGAAAYLGFGLVVGGGVCTGAAIASQTALSRWFVRRRSMALSILYSSGAIGGYLAVKFILPWAMEAGGSWRAGWWVIVALSGLAGLLALTFVRERPEDVGQQPDGDTGGAGDAPARARPAFITATPWESRQVLSRPTYWLIVFSLVGGSGGYTLFLAHGIVHLQDLGHSIDVARGALATMTWTGLLAKAVMWQHDIARENLLYSERELEGIVRLRMVRQVKAEREAELRGERRLNKEEREAARREAMERHRAAKKAKDASAEAR